MTELSTSYDPKKVEDKWYEIWEKNKYFSSENNKNGEPFCIVMPPPNVTGQLHMGHALDDTLQDILVRWHRMKGDRTLWVPGTDHAGIATQAKVEASIAEEGLSKYDLGRDAFIDRIWEWKDKYHKRITNQIRQLGCSCDWDKERFTLDEGCSKAVREVFVRLYEEGLIYRNSYIINWCPHCATTISDVEVNHDPQQGHMWYFKYPVKDSTEHILIATTRPETILGDTAVAVHPDDERYQHLIGKTVILPLLDREIPIIADDYVDLEFGTGAVKITPAHDPNDFEIGLRHDLPQIHVIDKEAKMTKEAGQFAGLDRYECRKAIVKKLDELGLFEKQEDIEHAVGHCYRCDTVVEPLISPQWFVKMQPLADPAIDIVQNAEQYEDGGVKFIPRNFSKTYINWLNDIRDWCISRQLWWGHRIPVWYCNNCDEVICTKDDPTECPNCGSKDLKQDPDVLDTWFSSALWPFSTLGWPSKTDDLESFYPNSILVTGKDIIFFWVARMVFTGLHFMDKKPFSDVFIHGMVLDDQGRKMSKSLGNGIDPLEIVDKYGADTLRFTLITGNSPGNNIRFQEKRLESARNFTNKIWNASRFVIMNLDDFEPNKYQENELDLQLSDKWILERLRKTINKVSANFEKYELGEAARVIYDFTWNEFCDWYIELAKPRLYQDQGIEKYTAQFVLIKVLTNTMQLLHPFMPFISEEIWQSLIVKNPENNKDDLAKTIMLSLWPTTTNMQAYEAEAQDMDLIMELIHTIRNIRAEMNVPLGKKAELICHAQQAKLDKLSLGAHYIKTLANINNIEFKTEDTPAPEQSATGHVHGIDIFLPLKDLIDFDKEKARLKKEIANMDKELERLDKKLNNASFIEKAPENIVNKEKEKALDYQAKKKALQDRLADYEI